MTMILNAQLYRGYIIAANEKLEEESETRYFATIMPPNPEGLLNIILPCTDSPDRAVNDAQAWVDRSISDVLDDPDIEPWILQVCLHEFHMAA